MMFLDDEICMMDYNTIKVLRQIVGDYGKEYTDFYGRKGLVYSDDRIKIEKIERDLNLYATFHDSEWIKIWDNYHNQIIHKDFINYIKEIPEKEEEKILESSKYAILDKNCTNLKGKALKLHQIREAVDYLDNYEDDYIKIETKRIRVNSVIKSAIISHRVITKDNDSVVFNDTCDNNRVLINSYKEGSWQDYVICTANAKKRLDKMYDTIIKNSIDEECKVKLKD